MADISFVAAGERRDFRRLRPQRGSSGTRAPLTGRVSMDMLAVDVSGLNGVRVGTPVVLWGEGLPVEEAAQHAGTIAYELLCSVSRRVPLEPR